MVKKRKLRWFGTPGHGEETETKMVWPRLNVFWLSKDDPTVKGKRRRGRQKERWHDNIKKWTGMDFASSTRAAENRTKWKVIVVKSSVVPRRLANLMR